MDMERSIIVQHKNNFSTYLGDWKNLMNMMSIMRPGRTQRHPPPRIPAPFESLHMHTYDLSVVLEYLDSRLRILEEKPPFQMDYKAYAEAGVFLKAFYIFFRILLDDVSGIIEYFYKENERGIAVKKALRPFLTTLKRAYYLKTCPNY